MYSRRMYLLHTCFHKHYAVGKRMIPTRWLFIIIRDLGEYVFFWRSITEFRFSGEIYQGNVKIANIKIVIRFYAVDSLL